MTIKPFVFRHFVLLLTLLGLCFALTHVRLAWTDGDEGRYLAISSSIAKGLGQVEEYFPEPIPETITPSGYVWYLATWIRVFGPRLEWVRLSSVLPFVGFVACFAALVCKRTRRSGIGLWLAGCLVVFGAFQVQLLRYAWNLMSETSFLFLTYIFFVCQERPEEGKESVWDATLLGVLAAAATLVRPVGIALALAAGVYYFFRKKWKLLLVFVVAFALLYSLQIIRTYQILGVPFAHMSHYGTDDGSVGHSILNLVVDIWRGGMGYFFHNLPCDLFFSFFGTDGLLGRMHCPFLSLPLMWIVADMVLLGAMRRFRVPRMAEWFWLFYWLLVCSYNNVKGEPSSIGNYFFQPRYLAPVIPLAALYFADGLDLLATRLAHGARWAVCTRNAILVAAAAYALLTSLLVSGICLRNAWRFRNFVAWAPERVQSSGDECDIAFARYIEMGDWAGSHLPSNAIIASRKPQHTLLFSRLKGFRYDMDWISPDVHDVWQNALAYGRYGPVYLLQDAFPAYSGYGNTRVHVLDPVIANHQDELRLVHATEDPVTRLWLISSTVKEDVHSSH